MDRKGYARRCISAMRRRRGSLLRPWYVKKNLGRVCVMRGVCVRGVCGVWCVVCGVWCVVWGGAHTSWEWRHCNRPSFTCLMDPDISAARVPTPSITNKQGHHGTGMGWGRGRRGARIHDVFVRAGGGGRALASSPRINPPLPIIHCQCSGTKPCFNDQVLGSKAPHDLFHSCGGVQAGRLDLRL